MHDSGDTDAVIPITSTRYSIDTLKLPTVGPWRAWYDDGEVSTIQKTHLVNRVNVTKFFSRQEQNIITFS